jgi:nitrite reductase/ring-hydroxylating ferredoxin subunit
MTRWTPIARVDQCPPGNSLELVVEGRIIALFHVQGQFFALDGICPHQGGPLGRGELSERIVTCPWHGWQFDVCTGQCQLSPNVVQPTYPCKTEDGQVFIDLTGQNLTDENVTDEGS